MLSRRINKSEYANLCVGQRVVVKLGNSYVPVGSTGIVKAIKEYPRICWDVSIITVPENYSFDWFSGGHIELIDGNGPHEWDSLFEFS